MDHLGHRMSVSSALPIGRGSLVYGSADAGRTVCASPPRCAACPCSWSPLPPLPPRRHGEESLPSPAFARALREAGRRLNLAPHLVRGKVCARPQLQQYSRLHS